MAELISLLPQFAGLIEKGGVVGLFLIITGVLGWEVWRLRKEAEARRIEVVKVYRQRDRWRLAFTIVKAAADSKGAKYDLSDLADLIKENGDPA